MKKLAGAIFLLLSWKSSFCQQAAFADSVRHAYQIPELGYAVVSSDAVLDLQMAGFRKAGSQLRATNNDRFRIGSNTKAITGFIAAELVKQGKISWSTKFFDVFPELKAGSAPAYYSYTLLDLLSMRTRLIPYTYTDALPVKGQFGGNEDEQRYEFTKWFLKQKPAMNAKPVHFSNLGYVMAALMMERASGKSYKRLVRDLGEQLNIVFAFGQPNRADTLQTWGHDAHLKPEPPHDDYKLEWLLAAGNINMTLPDYAKFMQLQLKGLRGEPLMLSKEDFHFLHYGLNKFSVGWFQGEQNGKVYSYSEGNPGTFLSMAYICGDGNRGYIIFANVQSDKAEEGMRVLLKKLMDTYN